MRLYFATDIHGSETCWRKFLNAGKHYDADVLVLGGDMTGKALVPVISDGGGRWHATLLENRREMATEDEVVAFEDAVIKRGYYPFRTDPDELRELEGDEPRWHALFNEKMLETVAKWMALGDERLAGTGMRCICCPGNDDQFEVDTIIEQAKQVEPDLKARLDKAIAQVTAPAEKTVFSFHCPPYRSGLDDAPELTADMMLKDAGRAVKPVGSTAVREAIEEHQPALSVHGHIHEARGNCRIGRTLCINPGSSYEQGDLLGAVIDLDGKKKVKKFMLTSG